MAQISFLSLFDENENRIVISCSFCIWWLISSLLLKYNKALINQSKWNNKKKRKPRIFHKEIVLRLFYKLLIFFQYNHEYRIRGGKFNKNVWLFSWFFVVFYFHDYLIFIPKEYNIFMILVFHEKYWVYSIFYANNRGSSNDSVFFFLKQVTNTLYPNFFSFCLYNIGMNKKSSNIWELPYVDIQKSELRSYCQVSLWDESGYWKFIEPYIQKRFPLRQLRFKLEYKCFFVFLL